MYWRSSMAVETSWSLLLQPAAQNLCSRSYLGHGYSKMVLWKLSGSNLDMNQVSSKSKGWFDEALTCHKKRASKLFKNSHCKDCRNMRQEPQTYAALDRAYMAASFTFCAISSIVGREESISWNMKTIKGPFLCLEDPPKLSKTHTIDLPNWPARSSRHVCALVVLVGA